MPVAEQDRAPVSETGFVGGSTPPRHVFEFLVLFSASVSCPTNILFGFVIFIVVLDFRTISIGLLCSFSLSFLTAPKKKEKTEPKEKEIRRIIRDCKISVRKFARHNDGKFSSKIQQSL